MFDLPASLNINCRVRVTLTERGKEILEQELKMFKDNFGGSLAQELKSKKTFFGFFDYSDDNTYETELWNVMSLFGKEMYNGNPNLPIDSTIVILTK